MDNKIKPGSTRDVIYSTLLKSKHGLTGEELLAKTEDKTERTPIAIMRSLLDLTRTSLLVHRIQKTNPDTKRPVFYYFARNPDQIAVLENAGVKEIEVDLYQNADEKLVMQLVKDRRPLSEVALSYEAVLMSQK